MLNDLKKELKKVSSLERKKKNEYFFKTGKGEYSDGDIFIGARVPDLRKIAKQFSGLDFENLEILIQSKIHEERLLVILILVQNSREIQKGKKRLKIAKQFSALEKEQKKILKFYLKNRQFVNNWDLVDVSAHYILGQAILDGLEKKEILYTYVKSKNLGERRVAIISTGIFIREEKFEDTLKLAKILLDDNEDLIHKAVGWMLREVGKKNKIGEQKCEAFLRQNYSKIPRTTLRYAIEKMSEEKRQKFLKAIF